MEFQDRILTCVDCGDRVHLDGGRTAVLRRQELQERAEALQGLQGQARGSARRRRRHRPRTGRNDHQLLGLRQGNDGAVQADAGAPGVLQGMLPVPEIRRGRRRLTRRGPVTSGRPRSGVAFVFSGILPRRPGVQASRPSTRIMRTHYPAVSLSFSSRPRAAAAPRAGAAAAPGRGAAPAAAVTIVTLRTSPSKTPPNSSRPSGRSTRRPSSRRSKDASRKIFVKSGDAREGGHAAGPDRPGEAGGDGARHPVAAHEPRGGRRLLEGAGRAPPGAAQGRRHQPERVRHRAAQLRERAGALAASTRRCAKERSSCSTTASTAADRRRRRRHRGPRRRSRHDDHGDHDDRRQGGPRGLHSGPLDKRAGTAGRPAGADPRRRRQGHRDQSRSASSRRASIRRRRRCSPRACSRTRRPRSACSSSCALASSGARSRG